MLKKLARTIGIGGISCMSYIAGGLIALYGYTIMKQSVDAGAKGIHKVWHGDKNENE